MIATLVTYVVPLLAALAAGAVAGGLAARRLLVRQDIQARPIEPPPDPFVDAELDMAAERWGAERNQPQAAVGLMSDHLKQLYRLGLRKGWF